MKIKISPSILSADFSCLGEQIKMVESAGADMLHVDVMDGHFVPNITIGAQVVEDIRKITSLPLDVHLMIERPERFTADFLKAGSDMITLHIETISESQLVAQKRLIRKAGARMGISLNPETPLAKIKNVLSLADFFLVMAVHPGFGGQHFIPGVLSKIRKLRSIFDGDIAVDGGINESTAGDAVGAGATILAAGSYIFNAKNAASAIERLRNAHR